jgi:hypothetical protein
VVTQVAWHILLSQRYGFGNSSASRATLPEGAWSRGP